MTSYTEAGTICPFMEQNDSGTSSPGKKHETRFLR